jgi:PEP-CTERM motif
MRHFVPTALSATIALALAAPAVASVVAPVSGKVSVRADAEITNGGSDSVTHLGSWVGIPSTITASADAIAESPLGGFLDVFGTASAIWLSADAGSFTGRDFGWSWSLQNGDGGGSAALSAGDPNWVYEFTPNSNGTFNLNYTVTGSGQTFGLQGWDLFVDGSEALHLINSSNPASNGVFHYNLVAGQTYVFDLRNSANISTGGDLNDYAGFLNGDFQWSISALTGGVPEPATWAMMLIGFGMMGSAMRGRRGQDVVADAG